ncbi:hypothetical protein ACO2Q0_02635 [Phenylobacterium sp. VNQ135]|uniref:hypothetical protein n=1 Tax=Phenylobacterium sp. VNQ135 TaxID=3400922 RepID=UPI003C046CA7
MRDPRTIRQVFFAALEAGCSTERATRIANGEEAMPTVAEPVCEAVEPPPAPPADVAEKIAAMTPPEDITALRAAYATATGKKPYHGWGAGTLREKIAAAETSA